MSEAASFSGYSTHSAARGDYRQLTNELREQNFDTIRFATYRAACKLRFIQKKVNLHLVDIWNIIESFRENGLNAIDSSVEVKISRIELLLSTVYHNLNKRLPVAQQIDTDRAITMLLSFLLSAYDREDTGKLRVFSVKVALATMCAGKLLDKLRYIFSQISDASGMLDPHRFDDYLREVLALPTAVFEGPTFSYNEAAAKACFDPRTKVTVNLFLDTLMQDPSPPCLMWLPLLHRMASVEHVFHPIVCDGCGRDSFTGFRYKCQRCHNYQLCQDCFWRGRVSGSHTNQHEMKEYSSYKSPAKQLGHSIGKSLRCLPNFSNSKLPSFPDHPEKHLDLTNVVPATPSLLHNGFQNASSANFQYDSASLGSHGTFHSPNNSLLADVGSGGLDDEHKLIARYSAKLASRSMVNRSGDYSGAYPADGLAQRAAVARLEQRNKEILREIQRLQAMHTAASIGAGSLSGDTGGPGLVSELTALRQRKDELEGRMMGLQDSRRELMGQLEGLMRVLKTQQTPREMSPRSPSSLSGVGGDIKSAFRDSASSLGRPMATGPPAMMLASGGKFNSTLQTDLLSAADSITNTMSSLVKELGSDDESRDTVLENPAAMMNNHQSDVRRSANTYEDLDRR